MDDKINRKRKSFEKPVCKYGESCYQKNPEHHKRFKHPVKKENIPDKDENMNVLNGTRREKNSNSSVSTDNIQGSTSVPEKITDIDVQANVNEMSESKDVERDVNLFETVVNILKSMPSDFHDFWQFCELINASKPADALSDINIHLVGVYDLLIYNLPGDREIDIACHWRYFYDPPEFQTVLKKGGKDMFHIGYVRDDPSEMPSILASNSAAVSEKLTCVGDNIFCAVNTLLDKYLENSKAQLTKKISKIQKKLQEFAKTKNYSLNVQSTKVKQRQKKVVAKTFHGLGIVVPVKNDVGYRPLPDSNATMRSILKKISDASTSEKKLMLEETLDEIMSNVHFANDECDYGMGLELGIDLFCHGDTYFHHHILALLTLAYNLLERPKYSAIIKAHLKNRRKGSDLGTLDVTTLS